MRWGEVLATAPFVVLAIGVVGAGGYDIATTVAADPWALVPIGFVAWLVGGALYLHFAD